MKKWLILVSLLLTFSIGPFLFFNKLTPAQAGVSVTARILAICGNGIKEEGEQCDGNDLGGQTCFSLGYAGGILSCYPNCTFNTSGCTTPSPGGGGALPPTETKVILLGKAYPQAKITLLKDGKVMAITEADLLANFKIEIKNINGGVYTFSLWAEDKKGRKSVTFSFTLTVSFGMTTTVSGIFLPPTIELEKVRVAKGETLNIFGQTAPESEVYVHVESPEEIVKTTKAEKGGDWKYPFDTTLLDEGTHTTRARAESLEGFRSSFSTVLTFLVGKYKIEKICPKADFNKDGRTNLTDFSILLYWWGKSNPCVDQNGDGIVNLPDFSILMYYWTG